MRQQLGSLGDLTVLDRRELENYLLNESALARYMAMKGDMESVPDPGDIKEALTEATQNLLDVAVERRVLKMACRPVIPNRAAVLTRGGEKEFSTALTEQLEIAETQLGTLREGIQGYLAQVRGELETLSPEQMLKIIPGDEIIDAIFKKYRLKFDKRKDAPKIAASMAANEIPEEIKALLKKLCE